jgi:hypothetical protein
VVRNFQGNEFKLSYKGKVVSATEMKLTIEFPGRDPIEMTAKKAS